MTKSKWDIEWEKDSKEWRKRIKEIASQITKHPETRKHFSTKEIDCADKYIAIQKEYFPFVRL